MCFFAGITFSPRTSDHFDATAQECCEQKAVGLFQFFDIYLNMAAHLQRKRKCCDSFGDNRIRKADFPSIMSISKCVRKKGTLRNAIGVENRFFFHCFDLYIFIIVIYKRMYLQSAVEAQAEKILAWINCSSSINCENVLVKLQIFTPILVNLFSTVEERKALASMYCMRKPNMRCKNKDHIHSKPL